MKKILFLFIILLSYHSVIADETIVKFYMNDGSQPKEFKISDIENLDFIHSNLSYQMIIFHKDNGLKNEFDIRDIDSIRFENDTKMIIAMNTEIIEQNISDIDSIIFVWNSYEEIQIGTQIWMAKNLDVDHYRNGDSIPEVRDSATWVNATYGAWCYCNNYPGNDSIYGKLYNWYAVNDSRGLAPQGWHVPSDNEWKTLEMMSLGMSQSETDKYGLRGRNEGSKLAGRADLWMNGALDQNLSFGRSGFLGVPGGGRYGSSYFGSVGYCAFWWSSSEYSSINVICRYVHYLNTELIRKYHSKIYGFSVRCIKD